MVKVLLLKNLFDNQEVISLDDEPLQVFANPSDDLFFVSTKSGLIHVYQTVVGRKKHVYNLLHKFKPEAPCVSVKYVSAIDCIVTLEKDKKGGIVATVPRVYANWRPDQHTDFIKQTIPIRSSVSCLAMGVCSAETGRVVTATRTSISIWSLSRPSNSKLIIENILDIQTQTTSATLHLALHDSYLAFCSGTELQVLKIDVSQKPKTKENTKEETNTNTNTNTTTTTTPTTSTTTTTNPQDSDQQTFTNKKNKTSNSEEQQNKTLLKPAGQYFQSLDDDFFVECSFDPDIQFSGRLELIMASSSPSDVSEIFGPIATGHFVSVNEQAGWSLDDVNLLIFKRFPRDVFLHSLILVPEYDILDSNGVASSNPTNFNNNGTPNLSSATSGICCFVSSPHKGYLFGVSNPKSIAEYAYTSESIGSTCSNLLYSVSQNGLEMWALRNPRFIMDEKKNNFPSTCLLGLQSMIGVRQIAQVGEFLVVLSKITEDRTSRNSREPSILGWNLYVLHPTPVSLIHQDIIGITKTHDETYSQLMFEDFVILYNRLSQLNRALDMTKIQQLQQGGNDKKTSKQQLPTFQTTQAQQTPPSTPTLTHVASSLLGVGNSANNNANNNSTQSTPSSTPYSSMVFNVPFDPIAEREELVNLLKSTATMLANHYFSVKDFSHCAFFFTRSDVSFSTVVDKMYQTYDDHAREELIFYLDEMLFPRKSIPTFDNGSFFGPALPTTTTTLLYSPVSNSTMTVLIDQKAANQILSLYHQYAPSELNSVILDSTLRTYSISETLRLLEANKSYHNQLRDTVCRILMYIKTMQHPSELIQSQNPIPTPTTTTQKSTTTTIPQSNNSTIALEITDLEIKLVENLFQFHEQSLDEDLIEQFFTLPIELRELLTECIRLVDPWFLLHLCCICCGSNLTSTQGVPSAAATNQMATLADVRIPQVPTSQYPPLDRHFCFRALSRSLTSNFTISTTTPTLLSKPTTTTNTNSEKPEQVNFNFFTQKVIDQTRKKSDVNSSLLLMLFLEHEVLKHNRLEFIPNLSQLYQEMISKEKPEEYLRLNELTQLSNAKATQWLQFHATAFTTNRPDWLNSLPPLRSKIHPHSIEEKTRSPFSRNTQTSSTTNWKHIYVKKLQGLLCNTMLIQLDIEDFFKTCTLSPNLPNNDTSLSLRVLSFAHLKKVEDAIRLLLPSYPYIVLPFAQQFCTTTEHWRFLLDEILKISNLSRKNTNKANTNNSETTQADPELQPHLSELYDASLRYLGSKYETDEFLEFLPTNGNVAFFLPFIEHSVNQVAQKKLKTVILSSVSQLENQ